MSKSCLKCRSEFGCIFEEQTQKEIPAKGKESVILNESTHLDSSFFIRENLFSMCSSSKSSDNWHQIQTQEKWITGKDLATQCLPAWRIGRSFFQFLCWRSNFEKMVNREKFGSINAHNKSKKLKEIDILDRSRIAVVIRVIDEQVCDLNLFVYTRKHLQSSRNASFAQTHGHSDESMSDKESRWPQMENYCLHHDNFFYLLRFLSSRPVLLSNFTVVCDVVGKLQYMLKVRKVYFWILGKGAWDLLYLW